MLDLSPRMEAQALLYVAETEGADPEVAAQQWIDANMAEAMTVVHNAFMIRPDLEGSEWYADFLSAHRYMRRHGVAAAMKSVV